MVEESQPALLRAVEVMDRLRSPGGCPWDAAQTHESLARYLLEETYETLEAIEAGDPKLLREELGDLLLQVLFHARLAQELPPGQRFSIEDVAADLVDKLVRRHPHVFDARPREGLDTAAPTASELEQSWEQLKAREKKRGSLTDGVPQAQPALAYAAALVERAGRVGLEVTPAPASALTPSPSDDGDEFGARLFALVREAVAAGVDPETELRRVARAYRDAIRDAEAGSPA
jgi:XTP/dITP diphosphohydrolase